jgi:hypothetical protein
MRAMCARALDALRGIAVSMREFDMWNTLEYISELPPEAFRTVEFNGDRIVLHQVGSKCIGEVAVTHEPYCRLNVELDVQPPRGWFWLKHWSENEPLVQALLDQGILELHESAMEPTGYVVCRAAKLKPKTFTAEIHGA